MAERDQSPSPERLLVEAARRRVNQRAADDSRSPTNLSEASDPSLAATTSGIESTASVADTSSGNLESTHTTLADPAQYLERKKGIAIHEKLGRGAFGVVYRGFDTRLQRNVAVKIAHRSIVARYPAHTFLHEARHVAQLDHSRIVPVYEFIEDSDVCAIVYKLIEGESLQDRIDRERMTPTEAASIISQACEALSHAHGRGVYHRDIKPSNILLDEQGQVYLVDFGLAVTEGALAGERNKISGTVFYMSPEQARGDAHCIDGRTDIYALGVVLYELCCGEQPFTGTRTSEVIEQILRREPRPLRQIEPSVPLELERICLKAVAKRPADRYATAADLRSDLLSWERKQRKPRRWYGLIALLALAVASSLVAVWISRANLMGPQPNHMVETEQPREPAVGWFEDRELRLRMWVWQGADDSRPMMTLRDAIPLQSDRDGVRLECEVAEGMKLGLFWFDTEGNWHELRPVLVEEAPAGRRQFVWPDVGQSQDIQGVSGTEVIVACASSSEPTRSALERIVGECPPWPALSPSEIIYFDHAASKRLLDRGPGGERRERSSAVLVCAETLRKQLAKEFDHVVGVAVCNVGPASD